MKNWAAALLFVLHFQFFIQMRYALTNLFCLTLEEVFAVFGITETIATGYVGGIVLHINFKFKIIEQQTLLLLNFIKYFFASHRCCKLTIGLSSSINLYLLETDFLVDNLDNLGFLFDGTSFKVGSFGKDVGFECFVFQAAGVDFDVEMGTHDGTAGS